jgi:hypothetical protein
MTLLPREDALAYLMADDEIPGAIQWAEYHGLQHNWDEGSLAFSLHLEGGSEREGEREHYLLSASVEGYRVVPPAWRFLDPRTGEDIGRAAFPKAGSFENGSVLHGNGVICAPWNRLAYAVHGGPHGDWTEPAKWQSVAPDRTTAHTIPAMLARIRAEVVISPGRLAPLPCLNHAGVHGEA